MRPVLLVCLLVSMGAAQVRKPDAERRTLNISVTKPAAIPKITPLPPKPLVNVRFTGRLQLDGLNCTNCTFEDAVLTYSGGAFICRDCWFSSSVVLQLQGPALNGLTLAHWAAQTQQNPQSAGPPPTGQSMPIAPNVHVVSLQSVAPK